MSVDPAAFPAYFRASYPEFDPAVATDSTVSMWDDVARLSVDQCRFGDLYDLGRSLFVAHHIALSMRDIAAAASGGVPGANQMPVTAKSVDKVSVSYDTSNLANTSPGSFWVQTRYGVQLAQLYRRMGAGGLQL